MAGPAAVAGPDVIIVARARSVTGTYELGTHSHWFLRKIRNNTTHDNSITSRQAG